METFPKSPAPENSAEQPRIKEGVNFVFEQYPALAAIGTKEQFSAYLDTIFPASKVHDILYHGTDTAFKKFSLDYVGANTNNKYKSIFLTPNKSVTEGYGDTVVSALANVTGEGREKLPEIKALILQDSPLAQEHRAEFEALTYEQVEEFLMPSPSKDGDPNDTGKAMEDYLLAVGVTGMQHEENKVVEVYDPAEIHTLGSDEDLEGFKAFVNAQSTPSS